tara:strand:- start:14999 stop:15211 length:213 start_codon:yes stop_codon:yes gene_type:complete
MAYLHIIHAFYQRPMNSGFRMIFQNCEYMKRKFLPKSLYNVESDVLSATQFKMRNHLNDLLSPAHEITSL